MAAEVTATSARLSKTVIFRSLKIHGNDYSSKQDSVGGYLMAPTESPAPKWGKDSFDLTRIPEDLNSKAVLTSKAFQQITMSKSNQDCFIDRVS